MTRRQWLAAAAAAAGAPLGRARAASPTRQPLAYRRPVLEKNFFLLAVLEESPEARAAVASDGALAELARAKRAAHERAAKSCVVDAGCHFAAFRWSAEEVDSVAGRIRALATSASGVRDAVERRLRPSGMFQRYADLSDGELVERAWRDAAAGMNRLIEVYGEGRPPRYPAIDSPMYEVESENYRRLLHVTTVALAEELDAAALFFHPPLRFALALLDNNLRDEAGRFEPMHEGENSAAWRQVASTEWSRFAYPAIVVPGAGSDRPGVPMSPWGKRRVALAARRYRQGAAPFLIVSGGFVHPNQTPFCEAIEMKRALMADFGVPEQAILIDPHARHTTTNLRNAARLLYRYGFPFEAKALITTDPYQSRYIEDAGFRERCDRELGYQPHRLVGRSSPFDLEFLPEIDSLHADAADPLDP